MIATKLRSNFMGLHHFTVSRRSFFCKKMLDLKYTLSFILKNKGGT